jgi:hypothetical protein
MSKELAKTHYLQTRCIICDIDPPAIAVSNSFNLEDVNTKTLQFKQQQKNKGKNYDPFENTKLTCQNEACKQVFLYKDAAAKGRRCEVVKI